MKLIRLMKRAFGLPAGESSDALRAAALLAYINLALRLRPFSKVICLGSVPIIPNETPQDQVIGPAVRAVKRASYAAPWRTACIHDGLALQLMLRRRGVPAVLCYGTRQLDGKLQAHVWVRVGDEIVLGEEDAPHYHLVATYPRVEESSTNRPLSSLST